MTSKQFNALKESAMEKKGKAVAVLSSCVEADNYAKAAAQFRDAKELEEKAKECLLVSLEVQAAVAVGQKLSDGYEASTAEIPVTGGGKVTLTFKESEAVVTGSDVGFENYTEERISLELRKEAADDKTVKKIIGLIGEDNFHKWFSMSVSKVANPSLSKDRLLTESTYTKVRDNFKYNKPSVSFKAGK